MITVLFLRNLQLLKITIIPTLPKPMKFYWSLYFPLGADLSALKALWLDL